MRASVRLGRVGGVAVRVSRTALVIVWLVTWSLAEFALPDLAPRLLVAVVRARSGVIGIGTYSPGWRTSEQTTIGS